MRIFVGLQQVEVLYLDNRPNTNTWVIELDLRLLVFVGNLLLIQKAIVAL